MSISESNNNIRIRTTPLGSDKYVKINLNQKFDFLEILSLKIGQEQIYKQYCSDYGVIVGRVVVNDGVGVPNAKISVFIPISEEDKQNSIIRSLYPYTTVNDVDNNNIKYNLLFETPRQDDVCHRSVGTFPEKRRILDCDTWCEVYGKYYKYTTSTNASGDYMIFGVPTGVQIVHMDVDLSDIGYLSQKPYDMVGQGSPETLFDSLNQFKTSPNLGQLPQIKTQNKTINVLPFWGDLEQCQIGINRVDFDLNYKLIPNAFFIGSIFTDTAKGSINKRCRPRRNIGTNSMLGTREGTIQMIRKTPNGGTEVFDVNGGRVIDENGTWVVQLPMNLESKITDEFGELVDSGSPNVGIATKAKYRFKIGLDEGGSTGRLRSTAKFLVPNYGDYTFDDTTPDTVTFQGNPYPNFAEMEWNGVYTVKQFISRFQKNDNIKNKNFIGIKDTADSGVMNPFPWNSISQDVSFLFLILCIIANIIGVIVKIVNFFIATFNGFLETLAEICVLGVCPFRGLRKFKIPCISIEIDGNRYCPNCFENKDSEPPCNEEPDDFTQAITASLAEAFDVFKFDFIHDWINGTLYAFPFKVKLKLNKSKPKFCDVDELIGNDYVVTYQCAGSGSATGIGGGYSSPFIVQGVDRGLIKYIDGEFFYAPKEAFDQSRLYPTGIYNLGSMKNCDVLGKPKIVTDIPITTFNVPDDTFNPDDDDISVEPFLTNINCFGLNTSSDQCLNHRLFCELGVAYNSDSGSHDILENDDISDDDYFDTSKLRAELECLNVPSICTNCSSPPTGRWTSASGDWAQYRTGTMLFNGRNINPYDKFILQNAYQQELIENSFYFYFGITPGKTAMDRLISQYFAPCERSEPCIILISGSVVNNVCISGNTGSITVNPKYGTPPYKYDWYEGFYVFGSTNKSLNTYTDTINNLFSGNYTVLVTDSVGNICKKTFVVLDPSKFTVNVDFSPYICPGANNGYISVTPDGGISPYYIDWKYGAPIDIYNTGNTNNSFYLTNLGPTSICTNGGITSFDPYSLPTTTSSGFYFKATRPPGTLPAFTTTTPTKITRFPIINTNNSFQPGYGYGNNSISPVSQSNSVFVAQQNGSYSFRVFIERIITNFVGTNTGSFTVKIEIYSNVAAANSGAPPGGGVTQQVVTLSYNSNLVATNYMVNLPPVFMVAGQAAIVNFFLPNTPQAIRPDDVNGSITWEGIFGGAGTIFPNTTNNKFYSFVVRDSGGSCESFSALTVDITQSCGFTLSATSIDDYCSASTKSSISLSVGGGGVPPFTYIIESTDANYFWSGKTSDTKITRNKVPGGSCPGYTYTATCIDACGSISTTLVKVVKSELRYVGYVQAAAKDDLKWYIFGFVGSSLEYDLNTTFYQNPFWFGSIDSNFSFRYTNPAPYWYQLPPNEYGNYATCVHISDGFYVAPERTPYDTTQDQINFGSTTNNTSINVQTIPSPLIICKNETFTYVAVLVNISNNDRIGKCVTIKSQGCSDKLKKCFT